MRLSTLGSPAVKNKKGWGNGINLNLKIYAIYLFFPLASGVLKTCVDFSSHKTPETL